MSGISSLGEQVPIRNVQGVLVGFIDEDHLSKGADHSFIKSTLFRHSCDVSMVHQPLDREEEARLPAISISDEARHPVLVLLLVVI